jgi:predicted transcriptional regulator
LGVVSQDELIRAYTQPGARSLMAEEIMQDGVPQVPPDIPLVAAVQLMQDQGVRALFLVHHAGGVVYPAAVITYQHILRHLAARDQDELRDLGIHAERQSPLQAFIARRDAARNRNQST